LFHLSSRGNQWESLERHKYARFFVPICNIRHGVARFLASRRATFRHFGKQRLIQAAPSKHSQAAMNILHSRHFSRPRITALKIEGFPFPPLLNLPPLEIYPQLFEQYLFTPFYEIFYLSFITENRERLRHTEGALTARKLAEIQKEEPPE